MLLRQLGEGLLNIVYPKRCPMCMEVIPVHEEEGICPNCMDDLPYISEPRCKKCSKPVFDEEVDLCFDCSKSEHYYSRGWALWLYEGKVRQALYRFKNNNNKIYGRIFGKEVVTLYYRDIIHSNIDMIIPVPLHSKKYKKRGYNQAKIIADAISEAVDIPCESHYLIRTINTKPQKHLSDVGRIHNMQKAFQVIRPECIENKRILLCDDIYTTGSTINGCAKALLRQGAREVYFITVAIGKGF